MAKRIALKDCIEVDSVDLSNFARSGQLHQRARAGRRVAGSTRPGRTSTWPAQPNSPSRSSSTAPTGPPKFTRPSTRSTATREVVAFAWRPDGSAIAVSATNPSLEGNVQLLTYSPAATRGEAETWTATFTAADAAGLAYVTAPDAAKAQTLRVEGLRDLNRAFERAPKTLKKEWTAGQRKIAEPTRRLAASKALTMARNVPRSPQWAEMRVGVTQSVVYVAPKERSRRYKSHAAIETQELGRHADGPGDATALEANALQIFREFDGFLAAVGRDWEKP